MMKRFKIFIDQFKSPLIYILFGAAAISLYLNEIIDAAIMLLVIVINAVVGFIQEVRAEDALEALKKLSSPHCYIKKNNIRTKILSSEIQVGDTLILEEGMIVAADAQIIEAVGLQVDESSLTGESIRVEKDITDGNNRIFESTIIVSGHGEAVVKAIGKDTEIGKISKIIEKKKEITPLQMKLNDLSKFLGIITILICVLMIIISIIRKEDLLEMLITSISLAVAAIPEGLMAVVTITLSIGVQKLVNVKTIVRHLPVVETLGSISLVCSDKTGTITENNMIVERIKSYDFNNEILLKAMVLCNSASLDGGDPTEVALLKYVSKIGMLDKIKNEAIKIEEIPFTSETKMMSVTVKEKDKIYNYSKGAYEVIINRCKFILINGKYEILNTFHKNNIEKELNNFYKDALRVLAFSMCVDGNEIFVGFVGEKDPLRKGVKESIKKLKNAGVKTIMITGDHKKTAEAIGRELGLIKNENEVTLGNQIETLTDEQLNNISIFARVNPIDKMKIVSRFKKIKYVCAMTGDGVNDAPSIKEADVGIAMGKNGTEVAKSVADIILVDDNFSTIEKAIETGRLIYDNIKKAVIFLLSSNLAEVFVMFFCLLLNIPLPLLAIHILWINVISDSLPALALGGDTSKDDLMKQKPRKKESSILAQGGWKTTIIYGLVISITAFIAFLIPPLFEALKRGFDMRFIIEDLMIALSKPNILIKARTYCFTALSFAELFHMIGMSDVNCSIIKIVKKKNTFMYIVLITGIMMQIFICQIPLFSNFFHVSALSFIEWVFLFILSLSPLVFHEFIRK